MVRNWQYFLYCVIDLQSRLEASEKVWLPLIVVFFFIPLLTWLRQTGLIDLWIMTPTKYRTNTWKRVRRAHKDSNWAVIMIVLINVNLLILRFRHVYTFKNAIWKKSTLEQLIWGSRLLYPYCIMFKEWFRVFVTTWTTWLVYYLVEHITAPLFSNNKMLL